MKQLVRKKIEEAIKSAGYSSRVDFNVETPPQLSMGDFATNVALIVASKEKSSPRDIADKIAHVLEKSAEIKKVEIAGPGFINLFLSEKIFESELRKIIESGENYGRGSNKKKKVQVEYISANPTGPFLHIGNVRGGPIGEALANLFSFLGYETEREFYVNDIGGQIDRLAESVYYFYAKKFDDRIEFPEGGYPGEYVKEISELIQKEKVDELAKIKEKSELLKIFEKETLYHTIKSIREDCERLGIKFDKWVYQSDFEHSGSTDAIVKQLEERGATVNKEGALWFKNPDDPELQDRESVLKKSDEKSSLTYFADDIAYHANKFERGFDLLIDVWGANHSGHVPRLKAALRTLGFPDQNLQIVLYQYVRLKNAGKVVSMGKRFGNFVTLSQVLEAGVEADALKYFILSQNSNTPFDFDLDLAADTSEKNPVFYIKYAHARICSILERVGEQEKHNIDKFNFSLLTDQREIALYKELIKFPELLVGISENFQVQALPHFAHKIAGLFHDFYANCRVITDDKAMSLSRLSLVLATKYVLKNTLEVCDIEAPEKM